MSLLQIKASAPLRLSVLEREVHCVVPHNFPMGKKILGFGGNHKFVLIYILKRSHILMSAKEITTLLNLKLPPEEKRNFQWSQMYDYSFLMPLHLSVSPLISLVSLLSSKALHLLLANFFKPIPTCKALDAFFPPVRKTQMAFIYTS